MAKFGLVVVLFIISVKSIENNDAQPACASHMKSVKLMSSKKLDAKLDGCTLKLAITSDACVGEKCGKLETSGKDEIPGPIQSQGDQGLLGEAGTIGKDRNPGPKEPEGDKGPSGNAGINGKDGNPGPKGPPGDKGSPGDAGMNGKDGKPGPKGPQGDKGPPGDAGMNGDKGIPGDKGELGARGAPGLPGSPAMTENESSRIKKGSEERPFHTCSELSEEAANKFLNPADSFEVRCESKSVTCLLDTAQKDIVKEIAFNSPTWFSATGFNVADFYNLKPSNLNYLTEISSSVTQVVEFHFKNIDSKEFSPRIIQWNGESIEKTASDKTPLTYILSNCDESTEVQGGWNCQKMVINEDKKFGYAPLRDVYISVDKDISVKPVFKKLCFGN